MNTPPQVNEIKPFHEDFIQMIENIKFQQVNDQFQTTLSNDLKKTHRSSNVFIFADKTGNIYETPLNTYNKLLKERWSGSITIQ